MGGGQAGQVDGVSLSIKLGGVMQGLSGGGGGAGLGTDRGHLLSPGHDSIPDKLGTIRQCHEQI